MKAINTKFTEPYKNKLVNIPYLKHDGKQSGVYFIKNKRTDKVVYIGYSEGRLYGTIIRHFNQWVDISRTEKTRFTYDREKFLIRVIYTTPKRAALLEKYLIVKFKPEDNIRKYNEYLSNPEIKYVEEILKDTEYYSGSEKDFPF